MTRSEKYIGNILKRKFTGVAQPEGYKIIPLTKGKETIVDNEDFEKLKEINWHYDGRYAENNKLGYLHRHLNSKAGLMTDHINGDKLDNRKINLRVCTSAENIRNSKGKKGSSEYKGVSFNKLSGKWEAYITYNYKRMHLGLHENEWDAAQSYNLKAKELYKEFAKLNIKL